MASLVITMPDQQLSFMKQMLSHFQFLTIEEEPQTATVQEPQQRLSVYKREVFENLKEAVEEMKLIQQGKLKARPIEELFDEL